MKANLQAVLFVLVSALTHTANAAPYTHYPPYYPAPQAASSAPAAIAKAVIPTRLEFRLYKSKDSRKIFDVKAGGNSAVVHYRKQFKHPYRYSRQASYQSL
jgi:hypothetical protein